MTNRLSQARRAKGLTQTELGMRTGLSNNYISKFERETVKPWPKARKAICFELKEDERTLFPWIVDDRRDR